MFIGGRTFDWLMHDQWDPNFVNSFVQKSLKPTFVCENLLTVPVNVIAMTYWQISMFFLTMCLELQGSNLNQTETAVKDEMVNLKYYTVLGKSKNWLFCVISRRFWGFVVSISARSKNQFLFNFFYFRGIWPSL